MTHEQSQAPAEGDDALRRLAENMEITGPDDDGLVWLVLHGRGTTGKAMFNLGGSQRLAAQVAVLFEQDRRAALANVQPKGMTPIQVRDGIADWIETNIQHSEFWTPEVVELIRSIEINERAAVQAPAPEQGLPPLEESLKRAFYYDERGEWRGPGGDEWDRWHAVAKVAVAQAPAPAHGAEMAEPVEMSPEFTDTARAALLWVLWHHQGGSSPVGQPIRFALGMGADDRLNEHQIGEAKRWAEITGWTTERVQKYHPSTAAPANHASSVTHDDDALIAAMHKLEDAYFRRGLPSFETAAEHIEHAAGLIQAPAVGAEPEIPDYAVEINRLRNVIQAACSGGLDHMIERWKVLFPDAPVPTVRAPAISRDCPYCRYTGTVHCGDVADKIRALGGELGHCSNAQVCGKREGEAKPPVQGSQP